MSTTVVTILLLLAISKTTVATKVAYQPIKITVNENFFDQPSEIDPKLISLNPNYVHQGANFFFNPEVKLPEGLIPPHIEALLASLHEKDVSTDLENKPEIVLNDEENLDETILTPEEPEDIIRDDVVEEPIVVPVELAVPEPIEVIEEDEEDVRLPVEEEPVPIIQELIPIPPAPILPPLPVDFIQSILAELVAAKQPVEVIPHLVPEIKERPSYLEQAIEVLPTLHNGPPAPIPRPIVVPNIQESVILDKVIRPDHYIVVKKEMVPIIISRPKEVIESTLVEKDVAEVVKTVPIQPLSLVPLPNLKFMLDQSRLQPRRPLVQLRSQADYNVSVPNVIMHAKSPNMLK